MGWSMQNWLKNKLLYTKMSKNNKINNLQSLYQEDNIINVKVYLNINVIMILKSIEFSIASGLWVFSLYLAFSQRLRIKNCSSDF